jgi:LuxR family quorum-sensing system transcriptional regulator CciR
MFAARKSVFVDLLKWDVPVLEGRYEVDQFDDQHATYLIVPGESHGSCSFATRRGEPIEPDALPRAQLVGAFAFEAARRLWKIRAVDKPVPGLTDRQRDCLLWAARGKSDWEISRILGISHETVIQHLKQARERYGVGKRTLLAVHALFDGTISFLDIVKP